MIIWGFSRERSEGGVSKRLTNINCIFIHKKIRKIYLKATIGSCAERYHYIQLYTV